MEINKSKEGDTTVLRLTGRLDTNTSPGFEKELLAALNEKMDVTVDFSDIPYVSSAGLRSLLIGHKTATQKGVHMRLRGVQPMVMEVFTMTGFANILEIVTE